MRPRLSRTPPKEDERRLFLVAQSQESAKIGVRGNHGPSFARGPGENFAVGRILHFVIANVNRIVAGGPKTLCDYG